MSVMARSDDFYRRGVTLMGKGKKGTKCNNKTLNTNNGAANPDSMANTAGSGSHSRVGDVLKEVMVAVVSSLIVSCLGIAFMVYVNSEYVFPNEIARLETKIDGLNDSLSKRIDDFDDRLDAIDGRLGNLENIVSAETGNPVKQKYTAYNLTPEGIKVMPMVAFVEDYSTNAGLDCSDDTLVFATDRKSGKEKTTKSLIGKGVLLPYKEKDGEEVYFLGQFNKKYHWDGKCITNVYKNNRLILITEALYADGNLISYKQVLESHSDKSGDVWIIANRKRQGNVNKGTSSSYYKKKDIKKEFTMNNVEASAILSVSKFKDNLDAKEEGFYCGNTRNGEYNDNTGKAYLVKYNEEGKVRLFYCGRFKGGMQDDHTGQAWDIVLGNDGKYVYREAEYSNNHIDYSTVVSKDSDMTKEKINRKLKEKFKGVKIKCKLAWDF